MKPVNIKLVDSEQRLIKLLDFGIVSSESDEGITSLSGFLGSKHYAPLEQLLGGSADALTDIYSVGALLFECYERRAPYHDVGTEAAIALKMKDSPEELRPRHDTALDRKLVDLINRCMSRDRASRPSSAEAARKEVEKLLGI